MTSESQLSAYHWLPTPMWVFDLDGRRNHWANPAALEFWGCGDLDTFRARDFSDFSAAAEPRARDSMEAHGRGEVTVQEWTIYPEGRPTTVVAHASGVRLHDGRQAILIQALVRPETPDPVTVRSVAAVHHTPLLIAMHTLEGAVLMRNPAALAAWGPVQPESGETDDLTALFVEPCRAERLLRAVTTHQTYSSREQLKTRSGPLWVQLSARQVRDPVTGEDLIQLDARDITDVVQAEHALRTAVVAANQASEAKSRFLANMSHEIRTPMNGVLGMLDLIRDTDSADERQQYLGIARQSARALLAVIGDILDFSRIESGAFSLQPRPFELRDLLDEALLPLRHRAAAQGLAFHKEVAADLPAWVHGDPDRLRQVLINLVGNAIKFTESGSVRVVATHRPVPSTDAVVFQLSITDTGPGIPASERRAIFRAFEQVDMSAGRTFGGTGLGLAISQELAIRMGGEIQVDSIVGEGSTFTLTVQVKRVARGVLEASADRHQEAPLTPFGGGRTVLVVDDNAVNQLVARRFLQRLGFKAIVAGGGQEALANTRPRVAVLMDLQMPDMSGFQTTRALRRREQDAEQPRTPIIALTAHARPEDRVACLHAGMDDYLRKPLDFGELAEVLRKWVGADGVADVGSGPALH